MPRRRSTHARVQTYLGQSSKSRGKPGPKKRPSTPVDPEVVRQALLEEEARQAAAKQVANSRWANRDRSVPANPWSGA
jgi:hypothetical protein